MQNLNHFIGKVCTVFTSPINRNYKEEQLHNYFLGVVESVDSEGISLGQLTGNLKTFLFFPHIVGIAEEEVLNPDDPQDAETIGKLKEAAKKQIKDWNVPPPSSSPHFAEGRANSVKMPFLRRSSRF